MSVLSRLLLCLLPILLTPILAAEKPAERYSYNRGITLRSFFERSLAVGNASRQNELIKRQDCGDGSTSCSDGCWQGANDICCPDGGSACPAGQACCGDSGCVPLDGSVCCANSDYCPANFFCGNYQDSPVCCYDASCQFLLADGGGTLTVTDGVATAIGTGFVTTVDATATGAAATTTAGVAAPTTAGGAATSTAASGSTPSSGVYVADGRTLGFGTVALVVLAAVMVMAF